jgi:hypothetical protein
MPSLRLNCSPGCAGKVRSKHIYAEEVMLEAPCLTVFVLLASASSGFRARALPLDARPTLTLRRHP